MWERVDVGESVIKPKCKHHRSIEAKPEKSYLLSLMDLIIAMYKNYS